MTFYREPPQLVGTRVALLDNKKDCNFRTTIKTTTIMTEGRNLKSPSSFSSCSATLSPNIVNHGDPPQLTNNKSRSNKVPKHMEILVLSNGWVDCCYEG